MAESVTMYAAEKYTMTNRQEKNLSRSLLQDIKLKNEPKHGCEKSIAELIKLTMYFKKTQLW